MLRVVGGASYELPEDLAKVYAEGAQKMLLLSHHPFGGSDSGTSEAFTFMDYPDIVNSFVDDAGEPNIEIPNGNSDIYLVNGQYEVRRSRTHAAPGCPAHWAVRFSRIGRGP